MTSNTDPREIIAGATNSHHVSAYNGTTMTCSCGYQWPTDKEHAEHQADAVLAALRDAGLLRDEPACGARWPVVEEVTCDLTQDHGGDHHGRIEDVEWYTSVDDAGEAIQ